MADYYLASASLYSPRFEHWSAHVTVNRRIPDALALYGLGALAYYAFATLRNGRKPPGLETLLYPFSLTADIVCYLLKGP